jgi:hypothetical protein
LYAERPGVWRPQAEIRMGVLYGGVFTACAAFVAIYSLLIARKSAATGGQYGFLFGLASGASMACGGYAAHPIQAELAVGWFVLTIIEATLGGAVVGLIVAPRSSDGA